jgi:Fe-S cluster assembly iron-binding protein IscA
MRLLAVVGVFLAGCSDKPAPVIVPVTPRPVVEVSPEAAKLLRNIAIQSKLADPWWVRLSVSWHPDPFIHVDLDRKLPGPDDYTTEATSLKVVFARELMAYLRGSRIEVIQTADGVGFDVSFPNQNAGEREAAGKWLREEGRKHKAK